MNKLCERARKLFPFSHSKTAISFNILLVLLILHLSNTYIFRSQITSSYTYNQCSSLLLYLWYGVVYINDSYVYRQNTNIEKIYVYASERSERALKNFSHFYILRLLFLSIFCWYFRYFVRLSIQMTCLSAYM